MATDTSVGRVRCLYARAATCHSCLPSSRRSVRPRTTGSGKMRRRAHFDIPLSQDATGRFLPWIIALMVFLAVLALAVSLILSGLARRWDSELSSGMTVQVAPTGTANAREMDERVRKVMDALAASAFVADASRLSDADAQIGRASCRERV